MRYPTTPKIEITHDLESVTLNPGNFLAIFIGLEYPIEIRVLKNGKTEIFYNKRLEQAGEITVKDFEDFYPMPQY